MIDDRLLPMFRVLKTFRAAQPGTALHKMFVERTLPHAAAQETNAKVRGYLTREIGRAR